MNIVSPVAGIPQSTSVMMALAAGRVEEAAKTVKDMTVPLSPGAAAFMAQHKPEQVGFEVRSLLIMQGS